MKLPIEPNLRGRRDLLVSLGTQILADSLLELAVTNEAAHDIVFRLTSAKNELADRIEARMATIRLGRSRFVDDIADRLDSILADIAAVGREDARLGVGLCLRFYELDGPMMEYSDNTQYDVEFAFEEEAHRVFLHLAERCADKDWLTDSILEVIGHDEWGLRGVLLSSARRFLDESMVKSLIVRLRKPGWSREGTNPSGLDLAIGLAVELADAPLVEELAQARFGEVPLHCRLDIARIHLASGNAETALSCLASIPESEMRSNREIEALIFDVHRALGNADKLAEIAWRRFRRHRTNHTLDGLLGVIGTHRRESVLAEELAMIGAAPAFSSFDVEFLVEIGRLQDASRYVIARREITPGAEWPYLVPVAVALGQQGFPLAASCIYRALVVSILERKQTKAYHHGADYLLRLKQLDHLITDRHDIVPHAVFEADLKRLHGRKWSFWQQIEG